MTSKEALENIKKLFTFIGCSSKDKYELGVIEKDLEVLEILKNNMVDINYFKESLIFGCDYNDSVGTLRKLLSNEKELIKAWLENKQ